MKTGADGSASLGSVRPGSFVISVVGESLPRRAYMPELGTVTVTGGEKAEVRIAIPMRQISFTQFGDTADACSDQIAPCGDD